MRQWMLRITAYAERLLNDLDTIDWSHSLKEMQRNWIGRSEGAEVEFKIDGSSENIRVFTTRPDTLFGATYMVLAPEHRLVDQITTPEHRDAVAKYKTEVAKKSDLERTELAKEKTGVFTGADAINPANGARIPIWIADYVLASYGTGAIMAVPGHDERDWEFAKKFNLEIRYVVAAPFDRAQARDFDPAEGYVETVQFVRDSSGKQQIGIITVNKPFVGEGVAFNSPIINDLPTPEAKKKITAWLEENGLGKKTINYKLRDWLFSRQRYWGEPFPILWRKTPDGTVQHEAVPESALPVLPPELTDYKPTTTGEPPLARAKDWVRQPDGSMRETNTMPQWAGSCWYYLRFLDARSDRALCDRQAERYWMGATAGLESKVLSHVSSTKHGTQDPGLAATTPGIDLYVGGTEHAVLHLLYSRFWHKILFDLGHVSTPEPFFKLVNQGLILGEDGQKMSKARGNVVNPDDMVAEFGADALRLYEMFMGPLEMVKPWNTKGVEGVYRFLGRVWRLFVDEKSETEFEQSLTADPHAGARLLDQIQIGATIRNIGASPAQLKTLHACIRKVTEDLDGLRFNTAISALMIFVNDAIGWETRPSSVLRDFLILLQPFAPHLAEELFAKLELQFATDAGHPALPLSYLPWPKYDPDLLLENTLEIPVQVNGKLRDVIRAPANADNATLEKLALASEKVQGFIAGKTVKKVIVVQKRMVNLIVASTNYQGNARVISSVDQLVNVLLTLGR
jgi:leucyl-tRNA synthetase